MKPRRAYAKSLGALLEQLAGVGHTPIHDGGNGIDCESCNARWSLEPGPGHGVALDERLRHCSRPAPGKAGAA